MIHISELVFLGCFLTVISTQITVRTTFSCENRPTGYYADMETGCQVYHMCDGLGRQFSYSCPNTTLFQQRMLICDHWYMVNCSKSEVDYSANLLIGQRDKPFVEDSENDRYIRTPRPDLLTETNIPEYNVIYRNGRAQSNAFSLKNNILPEDQIKSRSSTQIPSFSLPARWFSTYSPNAENEVKQFEWKKPKEIKPQSNYNKVIEDDEQTIDFKDAVKYNTDTVSTKINPIEDNTMINSIKGATAPQPTPNRRLDDGFTNYGTSLKTDNSELKSSIFPKIPAKTLQTLQELQQFHLIPSYEFPLEAVTRPSYDNTKSSFDTIPNLSRDN